jgi:2-oxoglutarate ferredoxin oxidoreductase subunit gamma
VIHYPYVRHPDILVCMSQSGYEKFVGQLKQDGVLILDHDLVHAEHTHPEVYTIPATRMAEELGRKMMANIIMFGFLTAVTGAVSIDAARLAVTESVPRGTEDQNLKAFGKGCDYGFAVLKGRQKKAEGKTGA